MLILDLLLPDGHHGILISILALILVLGVLVFVLIFVLFLRLRFLTVVLLLNGWQAH